jgi:uncharacterized protein
MIVHGGGFHSRLRMITGAPAAVVLVMLHGYQLVVSPWIQPSCRFYPSCSEYAIGAVRQYGATRGSWLTLRRLARCHPWNPGGVDHVPGTARILVPSTPESAAVASASASAADSRSTTARRSEVLNA